MNLYLLSTFTSVSPACTTPAWPRVACCFILAARSFSRCRAALPDANANPFPLSASCANTAPHVSQSDLPGTTDDKPSDQHVTSERTAGFVQAPSKRYKTASVREVEYNFLSGYKWHTLMGALDLRDKEEVTVCVERGCAPTGSRSPRSACTCRVQASPTIMVYHTCLRQVTTCLDWNLFATTLAAAYCTSKPW